MNDVRCKKCRHNIVCIHKDRFLEYSAKVHKIAIEYEAFAKVDPACMYFFANVERTK